MRRLRKIILLVPLVGIPLMGLLILRQLGPAPERVRLVAQSELSRVLGRKVTIGGVSRGLLKRAVLRDVEIGPPLDTEGRPLLRAPSVTVDYRLGDLLTGRVDAAGSVGRVVVNRPRLVVERSEQGAWSIADIIERPRPAEPSKFRGRIVIRNGQVTFTDRAAPGGRAVFRVRRVNGDVDLGRPGRVQVALSCQAADGRFRRLRLVGGFDTASRTIEGNLEVAALSAAGFNHYMPPRAPVQITSGTVDGQVAATVALGEQANWSADVALNDVGVGVPQLGRRATVSGRVRVMDDVVRLDGVGVKSGATSLHVSGLVAGLPDPTLDLTVEASNSRPMATLAPFVPKAFLERVTLEGPVTARLRVVGPAAKPAATGDMALAGVTAYGIHAGRPRARVSYRDGRVWIDDLDAEVAQGRLTGKAWFALGGDGANAVIRAEMEGVRAESITRALGVEPVNGRVSGQVAVNLAQGRPEAIGRLTLASGSVRGMGLERVDVLARYADGTLTVREAAVATPLGRAQASGKAAFGAEAGGLDLNVSLEGLDLAALGMLLGRGDLAGTASARGKVTGPFAAPTFEGTVTAADPGVAGYRADAFEARLSADKKQIRITRAALYAGGGRLIASGTVAGPDFARAGISGQVRARALDLGDLLAAAGLERAASGRVNATIELDGRLPLPGVSGTVEVAALEAGGMDLGSARADLSYADGTVTLSSAALKINGSSITAQGSIAADQLDLTASAADFDLSAVAVDRLTRARIALGGKINLEARLTGTPRQPAVAATLTDSWIALNGTRLRRLTAAGKWRQGRGELERLRFSLGKGGYVARGSVDTWTGALDLTCQAEQGDLAALRAAALALRRVPGTVGRAAGALGRLPAPFDGVLDAKARVGGTLSAPQGDVTFEVNHLVVGGVSAPALSGAVGFAGSRLEVERFVAKAEEAYATARGTVDLAGDINLDVDAYNISAQTIQSLAKVKQPLEGSANVSLVITGPIRAPRAIATATVSDARVGRLALGEVLVSRAEVGEDAIAVEDVRLALNGNQVSAGGKMAFAWTTPHLPPEGPVEISVSLGPDLGILAALVPDIVPKAKGSVGGEVHLGGTWARPQYEGRVRVKDGEIELGDFAQAKVDASLRLATAEGEEPVPVISGRVEVESVFGVPSLEVGPAEAARRLPRLLDPRLDIEVVIQDGTRLNTAAVDMWLEGKGRIGGTASAPTVRVNMESRRGSLQMPGARFRLIFAAIDLVRPAPTAEQPKPRWRLPINADYEGTGTRYETTGASRTYQVAMRLSGDLLDPDRPLDVRFRSVPDLPEREIYAMITGLGSIMGALREGAVSTLVGSQARDLFTAGYAPSQLQPIEERIARALHLEDFGIDFGAPGQDQSLRFRLGKELSERLYVTYSRAVSGEDGADRLQLTFELTPSWALGFSYEAEALRSASALTEGRRRTRTEIRKTVRF